MKGGHRNIFPGRGVPHELKCRIMINNLPNNVRKKKKKGYQSRYIYFFTPVIFSFFCDKHAGGKCETQKQKRKFILKTKSENNSDREPDMSVITFYQPDNKIKDNR